MPGLFMLSSIKSAIVFLNSAQGTLKTRTLRSTIWMGMSVSGATTLSLVKNIILARLLTPEIFGLMSISMIAIRGLELFTGTGFYAALIHRQDEVEEAKETAFTLTIIRGFVLFAILFSVSGYVAAYYEEEIIRGMLRLLAFMFVCNGFYNINMIDYEKSMNFKKVAYLHQAITTINFVVVLSLAYVYRNVWALVIGQVVSSLAGVVLSFIIVPGRPRLGIRKKYAKELIGYGKYITGLTIILFITAEIDNLVVGKVLGMDLLGYYFIAFSLANLPATHFSKVISKVMFPAYSTLQDDVAKLREVYLRVVYYVSCVVIPAMFGIGILSTEIVTIVYGDKWLPAAAPLKVLCVFGGLRAISSLNGYVYNAIGKPQIPFYMNTVKLFLVLAMIYPLAKNYSLMGVAVAVTVPPAMQFIVALYIFTRVIGLNFLDVGRRFVNPVGKSIAMAVLIVVCKRFFAVDDIYSLFGLVLIGMVFYALMNIREISSIAKGEFVPQI